MNSSYLGSFEWQRCKVELKKEQYRILSSALIFHRDQVANTMYLTMEKFRSSYLCWKLCLIFNDFTRSIRLFFLRRRGCLPCSTASSVLLIKSYQLFSSTRKLAQPGILLAVVRSQYLVPQLPLSKQEVKLKIIDRKADTNITKPRYFFFFFLFS